MDYRSREAVHIGDMFINSQMRNVRNDVDGVSITVGFEHRITGTQYMRTTHNRLVRLDVIDQDDVQFNLLSRDNKRFEPWEPGWRQGEQLELQRPFLRGDLIPPQTTWQWLRHDVGSRLVQFAAIGIAGRGALDAVSYVAQHAFGAAVAGTVAGAGAAGYAMHDHISHNDHNVDPHLHTAAHHPHAQEFDLGRDGDPEVDHWPEPQTHDLHEHPVPGTPDHPVTAPNGCELDGTFESAGRAMLPGACKTKVTWLAFDVQDDEPPVGGHNPAEEVPYDGGPIDIGYYGYGNPAGTTLNQPMSDAEKVILKTCAGAMAAGGALIACDAYADDLNAIGRSINRRLDVLRPPANRTANTRAYRRRA